MTNDLPFAVWQLKFHNGFYQLAPFDLRHLDGSIETDVNSSEDENSSILESQPKTQQMPALISTAAPPATTNQDSPLQNSDDIQKEYQNKLMINFTRCFVLRRRRLNTPFKC